MGELRFEVDCAANEIHFQEDMEILFVLSGRAAVTAGERGFTLESEGLTVFNPFELHEVTREAGGHTLSLYIPMDVLDQGGVGTILCCSALQPEKTVFLNILRSRLALLFQEYQCPTKNSLYLMSHLTSLLGMLRQEFEEKPVPFAQAQTEGQRLTAILAYIRDNLEEEVTLQSVAEVFYLSPAHLSRRFRQLTGYGFSDFVRILKLDRAANLLVHSSVSVTEIAARCGFGNANTFINAFQRRYGCTPGKYRRENRAQAAPELSSEISFMSLTQYLGQEDSQIPYLQKAEESVRISVDVSKPGKLLDLPHGKTAVIGSAKDLLLAPTQKLLEKAIREIGYTHVFFHGLLNSAMDFYHVGENGEPILNFIYIDLVLDFIVSQSAHPWIALDYTPLEMIQGEPNLFGESYVNLPGDLNLWDTVLTRLLEHFIGRYGKEELAHWRFSAQPAVYSYYGVFSLEEYEAYWMCTYQAVKRWLPDSPLSGFDLDAGFVLLEEDQTLERLLTFCRENHCLPDELGFQSFSCDYGGHDLQAAEHSLVDQNEDILSEPVPVSGDPDRTAYELDRIRAMMERCGVSEIPVSYDIWGNSIWGRELGNDTCFKSAWLVKNVLENRGRLRSAGVGLADYSERSIVNPNVFYGGQGVATYYGFPKAGYYALVLLSRLKGELLCAGDGYLAVRAGDDVTLMLYHYCHYDMQTHLTRQLPVEEQRIYDRYYGFEKKGPRSFQIDIRNLLPGMYESESYLINRLNGSSYDVWMRMGAPESFPVSRIRYLESASIPKLQYSQHLTDEHGSLLLSVLLEPHEVRLIRLKKVHES